VRILTQLPFLLYFLGMTVMGRLRDYDQLKLHAEQHDHLVITPFTYTRLRWLGFMKDLAIVIIPLINLAYNDIHGETHFAAYNLLILWLASIVFDHIREWRLFHQQLGYNTIDILVLIFACWSLVSLAAHVQYDKHDDDDITLDPVAALFFLCSARDLVFPISMLAFMVRLLGVNNSSRN